MTTPFRVGLTRDLRNAAGEPTFGAEALARELVLPMVDPQAFVIPLRLEQLAAAKRSGSIALTTLNGDIVANTNVTGGAGGVSRASSRSRSCAKRERNADRIRSAAPTAAPTASTTSSSEASRRGIVIECSPSERMTNAYRREPRPAVGSRRHGCPEDTGHDFTHPIYARGRVRNHPIVHGMMHGTVDVRRIVRWLAKIWEDP